MKPTDADWEQRAAELWAAFDECAAAAFTTRVDALAAELPGFPAGPAVPIALSGMPRQSE